ncbi:hypothetical protein C5167_013440 [Papaver somniferum]|uniref:Transmembrane 9 superfamily member n=1 Tax=Papaver somniferum TaxID=3469 RepID=A0A4Y7J2C0_PAPSO|nr:hypothetical protein C5167_013440 [Papaver somniferum]
MVKFISFLCILLLAYINLAFASESDHKYQVDAPVTLWVNKVGPYNNPQETYNYYSLPFCQPQPGNAAHKWGGLGEVLGGNELIDSQIEIKYQKNVDRSSICEINLDAPKVKEFKDAIESSYWFEFFMGFVGEPHSDKSSDDSRHMLYTHKNIVIKYNGEQEFPYLQIIHVNLTQESPKPLEVGKVIDMTYSVKWIPTDITFARRFDVYLDYPFFEHQYAREDDDLETLVTLSSLPAKISAITAKPLHQERDVSEESGWKLVHGDVFRPPRCLNLLAAVVGTGAQLAMLVLLVILLAIIGMLYIGRGAIVTTFIVCYALMSFISGYVSGGLYSRHGGKSWIKSMMLTASLFPFLVFGIGLFLNAIAISYGSLSAIPFGTMVVVFVIWAFISFPLALLGTVVGRNWNGAPNNPCRVKTIPRPIPEKKWYLTPSVVSILGGLLPFGSIFIEMYFVFTSFWNYKASLNFLDGLQTYVAVSILFKIFSIFVNVNVTVPFRWK